MRYLRLKRYFGLTLVVGFFLLGTGSANAGSAPIGTITSRLTCCTFSAPSFTQATGETITFLNPIGSDSFHNVTSKDLGPDNKPLFSSETETSGGSSTVEGTRYLPPGTYAFYCTIHQPSMSGELVVDSSGTAVPRPSIDVTVPSQSLKKVRNSGKLKVKVKGLTAASNVGVSASAGSKKLGSASGVSVAAGASKTVTIKLTSGGRKALKNKKKVSVSVKASVPFGKSDSASRKLH